MMTISDEQIIVFKKYKMKNFLKRANEYIHKFFPKLSNLNDPNFEDRIFKQIIKAQAYGFKFETHIMKFILPSLILGDDFDEKYKEVKSVLNIEKLSNDEKLFKLNNITVQLYNKI